MTENKHFFLAASKTFIKDGVAAETFTEEEGVKSFENQDNQKARLVQNICHYLEYNNALLKFSEFSFTVFYSEIYKGNSKKYKGKYR